MTSSAPPTPTPLPRSPSACATSGREGATRSVRRVHARAARGAFIALGAVLFTVVITGSTLGFGATRAARRVAFSLGLILVVVRRARAVHRQQPDRDGVASRLITFREVLANWALVYVGNLLGALGTVALVVVGRVHEFATAVWGRRCTGSRPQARARLVQAFALGVLCNTLVCLAVWLSLARAASPTRCSRSVFRSRRSSRSGSSTASRTWCSCRGTSSSTASREAASRRPSSPRVVTLGNIAGGPCSLAGVYWSVYLRRSKED